MEEGGVAELKDGGGVNRAGEVVVRDVQDLDAGERRQVVGEHPGHVVPGQVKHADQRQAPQSLRHRSDGVPRHVEVDHAGEPGHAVDGGEPVAGHVERREARARVVVVVVEAEDALEVVTGDIQGAEQRRAPERGVDAAVEGVVGEVDGEEAGEVGELGPVHGAREVPRREVEPPDGAARRAAAAASRSRQRQGEVGDLAERRADDVSVTEGAVGGAVGLGRR